MSLEEEHTETSDITCKSPGEHANRNDGVKAKRNDDDDTPVLTPMSPRDSYIIVQRRMKLRPERKQRENQSSKLHHVERDHEAFSRNVRVCRENEQPKRRMRNTWRHRQGGCPYPRNTWRHRQGVSSHPRNTWRRRHVQEPPPATRAVGVKSGSTPDAVYEKPADAVPASMKDTTRVTSKRLDPRFGTEALRGRHRKTANKKKLSEIKKRRQHSHVREPHEEEPDIAKEAIQQHQLEKAFAEDVQDEGEVQERQQNIETMCRLRAKAAEEKRSNDAMANRDFLKRQIQRKGSGKSHRTRNKDGVHSSKMTSTAHQTNATVTNSSIEEEENKSIEAWHTEEPFKIKPSKIEASHAEESVTSTENKSIEALHTEESFKIEAAQHTEEPSKIEAAHAEESFTLTETLLQTESVDAPRTEEPSDSTTDEAFATRGAYGADAGIEHLTKRGRQRPTTGKAQVQVPDWRDEQMPKGAVESVMITNQPGINGELTDDAQMT